MRAISLWAWGAAAGLATLVASVGRARAAQGTSGGGKPQQRPGGTSGGGKPQEPKSVPPSPEFVEPGTWPNDLKARAAYILEAVRDGRAEHHWTPIALAAGNHTGEIQVSADDLRVDGIRVSVDAATLQEIAASLGGVLATSRVADLVFAQAERSMAYLATDWWAEKPSTMATTARMIEYSAMVDDKIGMGTTLAANTGKWWVQSPRLATAPANQAANYGWHTGQGNAVVQKVGIAHDNSHVDYSQKARIMSDTMIVDGEARSTREVLADPNLSSLISSEGPL